MKTSDQFPAESGQYLDSTKLSVRSRLYRCFSRNPQSLHSWVYEHLHNRVERDVLELGCGPGNFWKANAGEISKEWRISLVDLSMGMVCEARHSLSRIPALFRYLVGDAEDIPFNTDIFDVVIANHMLYHVSDLDRTLREIVRILRPGGCLLAATNGRNHLREMREFVYEVDESIEFGFKDAYGTRDLSFSLENGIEQIQPHFDTVEQVLFEDGLLITEVEPVIEYVCSYPGNAKAKLSEGIKADQLREKIRSELDREGVFRVTTSAGLFIAKRDST